MLVDQNYPDVLPLGREPLECGLDGGVVRLAVDYKEVLLVVWRRGDMLDLLVSVEGYEDDYRGTETHPNAS
jgi:hypothetical protein